MKLNFKIKNFYALICDIRAAIGTLAHVFDFVLSCTLRFFEKVAPLENIWS